MNNLIIQLLACIIIGYCWGGINPAYILGKIKGFDIRTQGSGNAGASNALITMGKKTGLFCAMFDILKGFFAVKLGIKLFPLLKVAGILMGAFCILGHIVPAYMGFRGGKGLATLGGVILSQDIRIIAILLVFAVIIVCTCDYICMVAIGGAILFTIILGIKYGMSFLICFIPVDVAMILCHKENFRRIKYGVEAKISYLWRKEDEVARLQNNWDKLTEEQRKSFESKAYIEI